MSTEPFETICNMCPDSTGAMEEGMSCRRICWSAGARLAGRRNREDRRYSWDFVPASQNPIHA